MSIRIYEAIVRVVLETDEPDGLEKVMVDQLSDALFEACYVDISSEDLADHDIGPDGVSLSIDWETLKEVRK